jgi:hypothetical protein
MKEKRRSNIVNRKGTFIYLVKTGGKTTCQNNSGRDFTKRQEYMILIFQFMIKSAEKGMPFPRSGTI